MNKITNRGILIRAELLEEYKYFEKSLVKVGEENIMVYNEYIQTQDEVQRCYEALLRVTMPKHEKGLSEDDLIDLFGTPIRADILAENEPKKIADMLDDWDRKIELLKTNKVGDILKEKLSNTEVCITNIINGRIFHGYEMKSGLPRVRNDMLKFTSTGKRVQIQEVGVDGK